MRSLELDSFRLTLRVLLIAALLLIGWGAWFFFAELILYAVTDTARLEVGQEAHSVESPISDRVVANHLQLGQSVKRGDLLLELDSDHVRYQLDEKRAARTGFSKQLERLQAEREAQTLALGQAQQAESSALDEAKARLDEAEAAASLAKGDASRLSRMHAEGLVPKAEHERAEAEAQQRRAAARALQRSREKLEMDRRFEQSEKLALLAELERKAAELRAALTVLDATIARLEYELGQHRIRAPVDGRIGELVPLPVGSMVNAGDRVAAVVPAGEMKIVAEFSPPEALGRVRPEQKGRLRLEGFPWVQYGTVEATVARVANETRNGKIRVELAVEEAPSFPVPLQHGLPGTLEVEVERVSPAALVFRVVGKAFSRPSGDTRAVASDGNTP